MPINNADIGRVVADFLATFSDLPLKRKGLAELFDEQAAVIGQMQKIEQGLQHDDSLVVEKGLQIYDEMQDDEALGGFLDMKKTGRLATPWKIVAASNDNEDMIIRDYVEYLFAVMEGSLKDKLFDLMSATGYGYAAANMPLKYYDDGPFKGKIGIQTIKTKPPHNIKFDCDEYGNILPDGIIYESPDWEVKRLPRDAFILYSYRKQFERPYGRSDCRRCFRAWNSKRWVLRFWDIYLERFAGGFVDIKYKDGKGTKEDHATMQELINKLSTRTGIKHSDIFDIVYNEAAGRGADTFEKAVAARNISMARTVLTPDLLGFSEKPAGAYALGKKQFDVYSWVLNDLGQDLSETVVGEQIIRRMVNRNWPNVESYPDFVFEAYSKEEKYELLKVMIPAVEKGLLEPDLETRNKARAICDLSEKEETEEEQKARAGGSAPAGREDDSPLNQGEEEGHPPGRNATPALPPQLEEQRAGHSAPGRARIAKESQRLTFAAAPGPARLQRSLTTFEHKVDFASLIETTNTWQGVFVDTWSDYFRVQLDKLTRWLRDKKAIELRDDKAIGALALPRKVDMQKALARYMMGGVYFGAMQAQNEVKRGASFSIADMLHFETPNVIATPMTDIEKLFAERGLETTPAIRTAAAAAKRKAFWITGVETEKVLGQAKTIMYSGLHRGDRNWTEGELSRLFNGYIKTGEIVDGALGTVHRIETIGRTNFTTAINDGRRAKFEDRDVEQFVEAYQWSAVLDDATTPYCASLDGQILPKAEINAIGWPPAHFNCRSIIVPVVRGEKYKIDKMPSGLVRAIGFKRYACGCELTYFLKKVA